MGIADHPLIRNGKIRAVLIKDMSQAIDLFFEVRHTTPKARLIPEGFTAESLSEFILTVLETKGWHGVKDNG